MRYINLVYDDNYDDVDILLVPDFVAENVEDTSSKFLSWLNVSENQQRFLIVLEDGRQILGVETEGFLWWLNNVMINHGPKAKIIKQHTHIVLGYPNVEF